MVNLAPGASLVEVLALLPASRADSWILIPELEDDTPIDNLPFTEGKPQTLQSKDS